MELNRLMHFHKSFWHLEYDFSIFPSLHLLEAIIGEITRKATLATYWKNDGYRWYKEYCPVENL